MEKAVVVVVSLTGRMLKEGVSNGSDYIYENGVIIMSFSLSKVLILGTIHGLHKKNDSYSYKDIFEIIDKFNSDVLGMEIRPEDIDQGREYLLKYYPYEMIEAKDRYSHRSIIK